MIYTLTKDVSGTVIGVFVYFAKPAALPSGETECMVAEYAAAKASIRGVSLSAANGKTLAATSSPAAG